MIYLSVLCFVWEDSLSCRAVWRKLFWPLSVSKWRLLWQNDGSVLLPARLDRSRLWVRWAPHCLISHDHSVLRDHDSPFFALLECEDGHYGENCTQTCSCVNGGRCDTVTGRCVCPPGWVGELCQSGEFMDFPVAPLHKYILLSLFNFWLS